MSSFPSNQNIPYKLLPEVAEQLTVASGGVSFVVADVVGGNVNISAEFTNRVVAIEDIVAVTFSILEDTSSIPINSVITVVQAGAGQIEVVAENASVTVLSYGDRLKTAGQYAALQLVKTDETIWLVLGGVQ
jgi:hypothetical protein